jgi:hypothetical protein
MARAAGAAFSGSEKQQRPRDPAFIAGLRSLEMRAKCSALRPFRRRRRARGRLLQPRPGAPSACGRWLGHKAPGRRRVLDESSWRDSRWRSLCPDRCRSTQRSYRMVLGASFDAPTRRRSARASSRSRLGPVEGKERSEVMPPRSPKVRPAVLGSEDRPGFFVGPGTEGQALQAAPAGRSRGRANAARPPRASGWPKGGEAASGSRRGRERGRTRARGDRFGQLVREG